MTVELVPDYSFDDADAWTVSHSRLGSIQDGVLDISPTQFGASHEVSPNDVGALTGLQTYGYVLYVDETSGTGSMQWAIGGTQVWAPSYGAGMFSGTVVADYVGSGPSVNPLGYGITFFANLFGPTTTAKFSSLSVFKQNPYTGDFRNVHNTTLNALRDRRRKFVQAENAAVTYTVNWVPLLNTDTVSTSTWSSEDSGLTITNPASSPTTTSARLSGDVGRYRAVNQITTAAGDTFERYIDVVINDNSSGYSSDYGLVR